MKKETFGFMFGLVVLFAGYFAIQNYYISKQQHEMLSKEKLTTAYKPENKLSSTETHSAPLQPQANQVKTEEKPHELLPLIVATPEDLILKRSYATFEFTAKGGCIGKNVLENEQTSFQDTTPVSIISNDKICKAFGFIVGNEDLREASAGISKKSNGDIQVVQRSSQLEIIRTFHLTDVDYSGDFEIEVRNISNASINTNLGFELGASSDNASSGGMFSMHPPQFHGIAVRYEDGKVNREMTPFESSPEFKTLINDVSISPTWIATESLYWMSAIIPQTRTRLNFELIRTGYNLKKDNQSPIDQTVYEAWIKEPIVLSPNQTAKLSYKLYFGPKNETVLKNFEAYHLSEAIDYGFFKIVARPLYHALFFINGVFGNWGIAIILLTILINLIFLPLQIKGYSSAQKMQLLQPQMKALQEKYKEDKVTLQRETMALMSKSGVNPLSGCLPLLPQIPVFFGLDSALRHTFDLRQSPFIFWIHDLTLPDQFFVLPIFMAVLMVGYQKMVPMPQMDPAQAKMMKILPILFSVFMIFYPSGLALYVITNTTVSMVRQWFLTRHYKKQTPK